MSMDHFSYLTDDDAGAFFQKIACAEAEAEGVKPIVLQPSLMEKKAAASTPFEKISSRLDRDIGILKTAGDCGLSLGMNKRANVYLDKVLQEVSLSPEEFCHIFDKVAAEAIDTDMNMAFSQLCDGIPEEAHPWIEQELSKIAYEMSYAALMEKEAYLPLLRAGLAGARAIGVRGGAKAALKVGDKAFTGVGKAITGTAAKGAKGTASKWRQWRVGRQTKSLGNIEKGLNSRFARGTGEGAKAFRRKLQHERLAIQKNLAGPKMQEAASKRVAAGKVAPSPTGPATRVGDANMYRGGKGGGGLQGTTGGPRQPQKFRHEPAARAEQKSVQTQQQAEQGMEGARQAAKGPEAAKLTVLQGGKGGGAQPQLKPDVAPAAIPAVAPANAPKSMKEHWGSLTDNQKMMVVGGGYMAHDVLKD